MERETLVVGHESDGGTGGLQQRALHGLQGTLPGMEQQTQAPDRNLAMELARVTEAAALAAGRWLGKGDKNGADGAAVDAMRIILNSVSMEGVVVIGEGEKDEAPMLFNGEEIGAGGPACDIAVDPIDGTTLTSLGRNNAISVIAISERGTMFDPGPCVYMDKIAVGPAAADVIDIDAPVKTNLEAVAKASVKTSTTSPRSSSTVPATRTSSASAARPAPASSSSRTATSPPPSPWPRPPAAPTSCSASAARRKA